METPIEYTLKLIDALLGDQCEHKSGFLSSIKDAGYWDWDGLRLPDLETAKELDPTGEIYEIVLDAYKDYIAEANNENAN